MVCERCHGRGCIVPRDKDGNSLQKTARCPECQGSGIVSCCDTAGALDLTNPAHMATWSKRLESDYYEIQRMADRDE